MLCGSCGKRFTKLIVVDQTSSPTETEQTVFDVQALFNSTRNHEYECPFCNKKSYIILSTSLLVGNQNTLDYPTSLESKSKLFKGQTQSSLDTSPHCDDKERPQVLIINPQQLKNSAKIGRVVVIDENPISQGNL